MASVNDEAFTTDLVLFNIVRLHMPLAHEFKSRLGAFEDSFTFPFAVQLFLEVTRTISPTSQCV